MLTVCSVAKATINPIHKGERVRPAQNSMKPTPAVYRRLSNNRNHNNSSYSNESYFYYSSKDSSVEYRMAHGCDYYKKSNSLHFYDFEVFFIYEPNGDIDSILQEKKIDCLSTLFRTDRYDYLVYEHGNIYFWALPAPKYISGILLIDQNNPRRFDELEFKQEEILLTEQIGDNFRVITVKVKATYNFGGRFLNIVSSHLPIGRHKQQDKFYEYIYDLESKKTSRRKITKKEAKVLIYRKEK
jgi:hypothetical protein